MVFPEPGKPARMITCWEGDAMRANSTYQESGIVSAQLIVGWLIILQLPLSELLCFHVEGHFIACMTRRW